MGQLAGFRYREIVKRLKRLRFEFDRQAASSHEIWFNPETHRYTTLANRPGGYAGRDVAGDSQAGRRRTGSVLGQVVALTGTMPSRRAASVGVSCNRGASPIMVELTGSGAPSGPVRSMRSERGTL